MIARALAACCASTLLGAAVLALAWGGADLVTDPVRDALSEQRAAASRGAASFPHGAVERARRARSIDPLRADHRAYLGALYAWAALGFPAESESARAYRAAAISYYREALRARPTWGRAWASLAEAEALDGRPLASVWRTAERALELAPWDPAVQSKIMWIGFANWERLEPGARATVTSTVRSALRMPSSAEPLLALALQYGWDGRLEAMLSDAPRLALLRKMRAAGGHER